MSRREDYRVQRPELETLPEEVRIVVRRGILRQADNIVERNFLREWLDQVLPVAAQKRNSPKTR